MMWPYFTPGQLEALRRMQKHLPQTWGQAAEVVFFLEDDDSGDLPQFPFVSCKRFAALCAFCAGAGGTCILTMLVDSVGIVIFAPIVGWVAARITWIRYPTGIAPYLVWGPDEDEEEEPKQ